MKKYVIYQVNANSRKIETSKTVLAKSKKEALKQGFTGNCYNDIVLIGKA